LTSEVTLLLDRAPNARDYVLTANGPLLFEFLPHAARAPSQALDNRVYVQSMPMRLIVQHVSRLHGSWHSLC
jgi:hypothetical protein